MKISKSFIATVVILAVLLFKAPISTAQPPPDYSFTSPVHLSGTDRSVGAVYRFANVKTGVDAIVTITAISNATLAVLDQTGQGWNAAFQPNITVPSMQNGYVEFRIDFVTAGTFATFIQPQVGITALDVDGYNFAANQRLYEYEQFDMGINSYLEYEVAGTDLSLSYIGPSTVRATNVAGVDYGSINLSPNVRFTVFKSGVSSITVRSGANNQDVFNNVTRQRSFYFARFSYPNAALVLLNNSDLKSFNGLFKKEEGIKLTWELTENHTIEKIEIERSTGNNSFETIGTIAKAEFMSGYTDNTAPAVKLQYRIKLTEANGKSFYSKVITVNATNIDDMGLRVYPTICTHSATIIINSKQSVGGTVQISDYAGHLYATRAIMLREGENRIPIELSSMLPNGNYTLILNVGTNKYTKKIIINR